MAQGKALGGKHFFTPDGLAEFQVEMERRKKKVADTVPPTDRGETDTPLAPPAPGFCERAVNMVFNAAKRPVPMPGSKLMAKDAGGVPDRAGVSVDGLVEFGDDLLVIERGRFRRWTPDPGDPDNLAKGDFNTRVEPQGQGRELFAGREYTWAEIHNELVVCSGERERPLLLYRDTEGRLNGHWLGVPPPPDYTARVLKGAADDAPETGEGTDKTWLYYAVLTRSYRSEGYARLDNSAAVRVQAEQLENAGRVELVFPAVAALDPLWGRLSLRIFRTPLSGTAPYLLATLDWDGRGLVFIDDLAVNTDTGLIDREQWDVNLPPADAPPRAAWCATAGERLYLGNVTVARGDHISHRVAFSDLDRPNAFPRGNFVDLDRPVTGLGVARNNIIAFTAQSAHRLEESPARARPVTPYRIERRNGLVSGRGAVDTAAGLFYASEDGIYHTDGLKCRKVSDHLSRTWGGVENKKGVFGIYDLGTHKVWFFHTREGSGDPPARHLERAWCLDLLHSHLERDGGCFSTLLLDSKADYAEGNLRCSAAVYFKGRMVRGNKDGTASFTLPGEVWPWHEALDGRPFVGDSEAPLLDARNVRRLPVRYDFLSAGLDSGQRQALKKLGKTSFVIQPKSAGVLRVEGVAEGGASLASFSEFVSPILDTLDARVPAGAILDGKRPVASRARTMAQEFGVTNLYQLGMRHGLALEHRCLFTWEPTGNRLTLTDVAPRDTYRGGKNPWVGYLLFIETVVPADPMEDVPDLAGRFVEIVPQGNDEDDKFALSSGSVESLVTAPSLPEAADLDPLPALSGRARVYRPAGMDFEMLDLTVSGEFAGTPERVD